MKRFFLINFNANGSGSGDQRPQIINGASPKSQRNRSNRRKTNIKMRILITFMAIIFSIVTVKGQDNMVINFDSDSNITIAIDNIQRIIFNGNNIVLKTVSGDEDNYLLDDIAFITFLDNLSIPDIPDNPDNPDAIEKFMENIDVNIYMDGYGIIIVESLYEIQMITVFDINGKIVTSTNHNSINVSSLSMGIYLLRIETTQGTVNKKFIKNR
jgi:hypothetical protein